MGSQLDLDQGGTQRQWIRRWLGPSVGWVLVPDVSILSVTGGGTTNVLLGTVLVLVNFVGAVTINLPSAKASAAGAQALPFSFVGKPITVIDYGGNALNNNITIQAKGGAETIDGLASIQIAANYGAFTLNPKTDVGGYTLTQQ